MGCILYRSRCACRELLFIVRGVIAENPAGVADGASYQPLVLQLTQIVLIVPPTADTLLTVKNSCSRSNSNKCRGRPLLSFEVYSPRTIIRQYQNSPESSRSRSNGKGSNSSFLLFEAQSDENYRPLMLHHTESSHYVRTVRGE